MAPSASNDFPPQSWVGGGSFSVHRSVKNLSTDLRGERFDLYLVAVEDRNL